MDGVLWMRFSEYISGRVLETEPIYHKYTIAMEETCVKIQSREGQNL